MADITQYTQEIRQAVYGKDVRESIATGIETINTEVENTTARQTQLESDMATAKADAIQATADANTARGLANTAADNASTKATLADEKAILADQKATLADEKATAAQTATDNANTTVANINNNTLIIYKPWVNTFTDITTTYPTPELGWTTQTKDTFTRYRFNGIEWINIGVFTDDKIGNMGSITETNLVQAVLNDRSQLAHIAIQVEKFPLIYPETDDTSRVQRAINYLHENGGGTLHFTKPLYEIKQVEMFSNITFYSNKQSIIKCLDSGILSGDHATFYSKWAIQDLENIKFDGLVFDGNRLNIDYDYYHIIGVWVDNGRKLNNFNVVNCKFIDAKEDFIRITGKDISAKANNIKVDNCEFNGINTTYEDYPGNAFRILLYQYTLSNYGYIFATNIFINNCYGEKIRTLADLKRGCKNFIVTNNKTHNMYDIDFSVDGVFSGKIYSNIQDQDEEFTTFDGDNAFEIQGEDIQVYGNEVGYKKNNGIFITDYGHENEGVNIGHISKNIKIFGNTIKKVGEVGIKSINADNITVTDNNIINSNTPLSIVTNSGRKDSLGNLLKAKSSFVSNNKYCDYVYGIVINGESPVLGSGNTDTNGQVFIQYNNSPSMYVQSKGRELNFNPNLEIDVTTTRIKYWNSGEVNLLLSNTKPIGVLQGVTLNDTNTGSLGDVFNTNFDISAKKDNIIHLGIYTKQNTATEFGINIKEYQGTTWLSNNFINIPLSNEWNRFRTCYKVVNDLCDNIKVSLLPATGTNTPSKTGTTDVAMLNISDYPIN